jgi:hypothetical protein
MPDNQPTTEDNTQAVYGFVLEQLRYGMTEPEVVDMLVEEGLEHETATAIVKEVNGVKKESSREAGKKNMLVGSLWCGGGLLVTAITYSTAAGGGTYVVTWGAVIFGGIQLLRGIGQMWGD